MSLNYNYIYLNEYTGNKIYRNEPLPEDTEGYECWRLVFQRKDTQMKGNEVYKK